MESHGWTMVPTTLRFWAPRGSRKQKGISKWYSIHCTESNVFTIIKFPDFSNKGKLNQASELQLNEKTGHMSVYAEMEEVGGRYWTLETWITFVKKFFVIINTLNGNWSTKNVIMDIKNKLLKGDGYWKGIFCISAIADKCLNFTMNIMTWCILVA